MKPKRPASVATVINPYLASLQLYKTLMSGTTVPLPVRSLAGVARAQVRHDVSFMGTIDGLPPTRLGAFLGEFITDTAQLQTTLGTLELDLRTLTTPESHAIVRDGFPSPTGTSHTGTSQPPTPHADERR